MDGQMDQANQSHLSEVPLHSDLDPDLDQSTTTATTTTTTTTTVTIQPKSASAAAGGNKGFTRVALNIPFDEAHAEREWSSPLCSCRNNRGSCWWMCCCWPYYRYTVSSRLGETPFVPLVPCAALALRVKMRALFSIKGSLLKDFFTSLCCEPCVICQMVRELDSVGL